MNLASVFKKCSEHMLNQSEQSTKVESVLGEATAVCRMYGDDGRRDPIGILIPPDRYSESLEIVDVSHLLRFFGIQGDTARILIELQNIHDNIPPRGWRAALTEVAIAYKIPWPTRNGTARAETK